VACPDDNVLVAMAEQRLDPGEFAALEVHIDTCESCRQMLAVAVTERSLAVGTPTVDDADSIASFVDVSINDRYVVKSLLGKGGMGAVYLARDLTLDREVALKLHRAGSGSERLHREAMAMAKLAHPNVVTVFEVATVDDRLYVAMEYIRGETLRGWLTSVHPSWRQIIHLLLEVGTGLVAAHAAGLVHRDFKPENVLVGDDGRPRVGDFGLARVGASPSTTFRKYVPAVDNSTETAETLPAGDMSTDSSMTAAGTILGTPAYMAPEQLNGEVVDARCDQFGFCVVAWEALYGKRPFAGSTLTALHMAIADRAYVVPNKTAVPQRIRAVLERGLASEPADRYADMTALLAALRAAAAPRTKRHLALAAVAALALGGAALATITIVGNRRHEAACAAAGNDMLRIFDDAKRSEIRAAFVATGSPFAISASDRASDVLGRYTTVLATKAIGVCRGLGEPARISEVRRICLGDRRRDVAAFVDILTHADKPLVQRAASSAWGLFDPDPCNDPQTLLSRSSRTKAMTPEQDAEVRRIKALSDSGRYDDSLAAAKPLVAAARAPANKSLELDALLGLASVEAELEKPEARTDYEQAIALAETLGRDLDAAVAYAALANNAGVVTHQFADAHRYVGLARAKLERLGGRNPAIRGDLLMTEAQVLLDENRLGEAETAMRQASSTIEDAYGPDHPKLGGAFGTLSQIQRAQRKTSDSLTSSERALAILEKTLGTDHPTVAGAHMNLSQALMDVKRYDDAREHLLRADIVFARVYGDTHPLRAAVAGNLGGLEQLQGHWDAALVASRRAVTILEAVEGPNSADVSGARRDVARELALAGRIGDAIAEQTHAVSILDTMGADAEGRIVSALTELAEYQLAASQPALAIPHAERALAIATKRPQDANPVEVTSATRALATALYDAKRDRPRARKLVEGLRETDPAGRADHDTWLAAHPP
jgi:tetratricopeptide (TPR) repeat protein/predicted Ser/Thr protein kinase